MKSHSHLRYEIFFFQPQSVGVSISETAFAMSDK